MKETIERISIHSLIRGRTVNSSQVAQIKEFQSTPSYEGEQRRKYHGIQLWYFNPLPHTRENTERFWGIVGADNFNPLPHTRENAIPMPTRFTGWQISIHSLIRGRTNKTNNDAVLKSFQSTPSYEGEPYTLDFDSISSVISIHSLIRGRTVSSLSRSFIKYYFNPLPHTRENYGCCRTRLDLINFNPLPHTRENAQNQLRFRGHRNFNPLPHTRENVKPAISFTVLVGISIHSLIRGRTVLIHNEQQRKKISIHSLIRGRTSVTIFL